MKFRDNTVGATFDYFQLQLSDLYSRQEVKKLAELILEERLDYDSIHLSLHPEKRLTESEMLTLIADVKELKKGRPIQYILGKAQFLDLDLAVNEHTLIPRPETEELVEWIKKQNQNKEITMLDVGTGSGCVALALKSGLPSCHVTAVDISADALETARQNAVNNGLKVDFAMDDILNPGDFLNNKVWDLIVSNPPYVLKSQSDQMHKNVLEHEPHLALFVPDDNALIFYEHIADYALNHLNARGFLYLEINENLGKEVELLLRDKGFANIEVRQDLSGKDRMVRAELAHDHV